MKTTRKLSVSAENEQNLLITKAMQESESPLYQVKNRNEVRVSRIDPVFNPIEHLKEIYNLNNFAFRNDFDKFSKLDWITEISPIIEKLTAIGLNSLQVRQILKE